MTADISIIIPILNSTHINRTLAALHNQRCDLTRVEVLVVGLDEIGAVKADTLVRHIDTRSPRSAAQNRNQGMAEASGEIFCFIDADCIPAPDWLARLVAPYEDPTVSVVGGGVAFDAENYWILCDNVSWFHRFLATAKPGTRPHLPSLNLSVRRQIVDEIGAFDEYFPFAAGEDTDWTMRMRAAGYALHFEPAATVCHRPERGSFGQIWRHAYQYGRYTPQLRMQTASELRTTEGTWTPRQPWLLLAATPLLATLATARVVAARAGRLTTWAAIPGVWVSKVAWCLGAYQALRVVRYATTK